MDVSAVGIPQVKAITPLERPEVLVHPEGAPVTQNSSSFPQGSSVRADEPMRQSKVTTEVRRENAIGVNVTEFHDSKTGEVISQIPSRQIIAMAISLAEAAARKREG